MQELSLKKICLFIVFVMALFHFNKIIELLAPIYWWFADSLGAMRNFPPGAQSAIAFLTIVWIVMIVFKSINK